MTRPRALLVCPGRGAYTREALGTLARAAAASAAARARIARADAARRARGVEALSVLDAAEAFRPGVHLAPGNASALTFVGGCAEAAWVAEAADIEVVAVAGNSLGWYTALALAGALDFDDALRLVETVAALQEEPEAPAGGQVVYPLVQEDWRLAPECAAAVEEALAAARAAGAVAAWSIRFGGFAVLAGDPQGMAIVGATLPRVRLGQNDYPLTLARHLPFHTGLMAALAGRARGALAGVSFRAPCVSLVDGRGAIWRPRWADPKDLADYTLGAQMCEPFDFGAAVRVGLREFAPDRVVALGPGDTRGASAGGDRGRS